MSTGMMERRSIQWNFAFDLGGVATDSAAEYARAKYA
jgi:hypothetical protein